MAKLTAHQIALAAYKAGFRNNALITATAIALAESSGDTAATGFNAPSDDCPHGSTDQGLWQINDCYYPEVTPSCAGNVTCSASAAYRISNGGTNFASWNTFSNGAYRKLLQEATEAAAVVHSINKPSTPKKGLFHRELEHWQYLSQLTMPATAGYPPINRENDCGPACLSMLLSHLFDIYLSDDMINILEAGPSHVGYTSNNQMANYLKDAWQIATDMRVPKDANDAFKYAKQQIAQSYAVINLGDYYAEGAILRHYTVTTGVKSGHVIIADPGIGRKITVSRSDYFRRSYVTQICPLQARS